MTAEPMPHGSLQYHLIVLEDDESHTELIRRGFLNQPLFKVSFVQTIKEAQSLIVVDPPDLILADWLLPDGKGIDVLQQNDGCITIPLIIMTSHGDEELAVQMLKAGAIDYIVKSEFMYRDLPRIALRALQEWENSKKRNEAEKALQESEEKFSLIFHANPVINIITTLPDHRILDINTTFETVTGYQHDEILGRTTTDLGFWANHADHDVVLHILNMTGTYREGRHHFRKKNGELLICIYSSVIIDIGGQKCALSTLVDVTEHEAAVAALRESEIRFHEIFELSGEALFLVDANTNKIYEANSEAVTTYGYSRDQLVGLCYLDLSSEPEETRELVSGKKESVVVPLRYHRKKDGTIFPVEIAGRFFVYEGRGAFIIAIRDISDRKRAEDALKKSEEWYRRIVETLQEGIWLLASTDQVSNVNLHMAGMLGYTPDEMKKRPVTDFIHPDDLAGHEQTLAQRKKGLIGRYERNYIRKDGSACWGSVSSMPLFEDSTYSGTFEMITDITKRKEAEAESLKMYEDLVQAYDQLSVIEEELLKQNAILSKKQEDLSASEERYRQLFTSMNTGFAHHAIICDKEGRPVDYRFIDVNPAFVRHTGLSRDDILDKTILEVLPQTESYWIERYGHTALTGEPQVFEQYSSELDKYFDVSVYSPKKGEFITIFSDITTRKRAEIELAESEARYRNVVEDQTEFISRFTSDGTHVFANEAYCRYFGVTEEDVIGKKFHPRIFPEDLPRVAAYFTSLTMENPVGSIDQRTVMPDGEIRWQRWSNRAIFTREGILVEIQSVGRDITETKQAEEALRESEKKFRNIVDLAQEGIWAIDSDFVTTYVNPKMCALLGYTQEEMRGTSLFSYIPDLQVQKEGMIHLQRQMHGIREEFEYALWKKNGELIYVSLSAGPIRDEQGRVSGALAVVMDITRQKKLQENEQVALRRIDENIHQMAVLNDQIRNPLTIINVLCELDNPEHSEQIIEQINRIDELVREVDRGFVLSLKIRDYLKEYHDIVFDDNSG